MRCPAASIARSKWWPLSVNKPTTPFLSVNPQIVEANLARMAKEVAERGGRLRPHTKTHKTPYFAQRQLAHGADGITVAKLGEAQVMADAGIQDIFMAYPIIGEDKIARALAIHRQIRRFIVASDSLTGAAALSRAAVEAGITWELRCEVDTGLRRTGMVYENSEETICAIAALPGIYVTGIYTFRGAVLDGKPTQNWMEAGRQEGEMMTSLAQRLCEKGLDIRDISAGSTPTGLSVLGTGVTEVRQGTYIFNDVNELEMGVCREEDCAAVIVATVVSRPAPDLAIIDAGTKVFAADCPKATFGRCVGHPGILLERLSEEHGICRLENGEDPAIGSQLRFIPNHVCTCVNLTDTLWLENDGGWEPLPVAARGMSR